MFGFTILCIAAAATCRVEAYTPFRDFASIEECTASISESMKPVIDKAKSESGVYFQTGCTPFVGDPTTQEGMEDFTKYIEKRYGPDAKDSEKDA